MTVSQDQVKARKKIQTNSIRERNLQEDQPCEKRSRSQTRRESKSTMDRVNLEILELLQKDAMPPSTNQHTVYFNFRPTNHHGFPCGNVTFCQSYHDVTRWPNWDLPCMDASSMTKHAESLKEDILEEHVPASLGRFKACKSPCKITWEEEKDCTGPLLCKYSLLLHSNPIIVRNPTV